MSLILKIAKLGLPLIFLVGVAGTHYLTNANGGFDFLKASIKTGYLGESGVALRTHWTGVKVVDNLVSLFVCFFMPLFDERNPSLALQGLHFGGQLSSYWILIVIESFRSGNKATAAISIIAFGLFGELVAVALAIPVYCFVHLLTSPTVSSKPGSKSSARKALLQISEKDMMILPWSTGLGHFIPFLLCRTTSAATTTPLWESQQFWIIARLFHPVFTIIIHTILSKVLAEPASSKTATRRGRSGLRSLQILYDYATYVAVISHLATIIPIILSQTTAILTPKYIRAYNPYTVFQPVAFWSDFPQVTSLAQTSSTFLQWDEISSCAAVFLWAMALNREGLKGKVEGSSFLGMLGRSFGMILVGGPAAAAISLVKERDFVLLDEVVESGDGKRK